MLVIDSTSILESTENWHYRDLVGESLIMELCFTFLLEHITEPFVLGKGMSLVAVDNLVLLENYLFWINFFSSKHSSTSYHPNNGTLIYLTMTPLQLLRRTFCHYKYVTQQYAGWALDNDCKLLSQIVVCRLSRPWKVQFPSSSRRSREYRSHNNLVPAIADKKKLLEFLILLYFHI